MYFKPRKLKVPLEGHTCQKKLMCSSPDPYRRKFMSVCELYERDEFRCWDTVKELKLWNIVYEILVC